MFSEKIKELRLGLGMNQVEFAKILNVTKQSVSNWENNNIMPSIDMLVRIAKTFSVSTDYLLGLSATRTLNIDNLPENTVTHLQYIVDALKQNNT